jgi:hypothetical protein
MQALAEDFESNGKDVIEKVRTERPQDYLKVSGKLVGYSSGGPHGN